MTAPKNKSGDRVYKMKTEFDVLGIGNVLMDIIAPVADNFLTDNVIEKGSMTLIDEPRALALNTALKKASGVQEIVIWAMSPMTALGDALAQA